MSNDRTVPAVCHKFNSARSECTEDDCRELHICFYFATGNCRFGDECKRTHSLTTVHNKTVLRASGWQNENQHSKILELLEEKLKPKPRRPEQDGTGGLKSLKVCFIYNTLGCTNKDCLLLHLCLNFLMNRCTQGSKCHLGHDLAGDDHNIRVLRSAKLIDTEQQLIVETLKDKYIAMSDQADLENKTAEAKVREKLVEKLKVETALSNEEDGDTDRPKLKCTPVACIAYNSDGCNTDSCPFLHVCFSYIMGTCNKEEQCLKEHNVFQGEQNKEVLRRFDLLDAKDVYSKIRAGYETRAVAKAATTESPAGAEGGATEPPPPPLCPDAPASLTCSVCLEPFIRATTLGCTHTFCEECVRRAERGGQPCPLCRAPVATAVRSLAIDDMVDAWFADRDEETQRARRQLVTERAHEAEKNKPPASGLQPFGRLEPFGSAAPARSRSASPRGAAFLDGHYAGLYAHLLREANATVWSAAPGAGGHRGLFPSHRQHNGWVVHRQGGGNTARAAPARNPHHHSVRAAAAVPTAQRKSAATARNKPSAGKQQQPQHSNSKGGGAKKVAPATQQKSAATARNKPPAGKQQQQQHSNSKGGGAKKAAPATQQKNSATAGNKPTAVKQRQQQQQQQHSNAKGSGVKKATKTTQQKHAATTKNKPSNGKQQHKQRLKPK